MVSPDTGTGVRLEFLSNKLNATNTERDDTRYKFVELVYLKDNYTKHDPSCSGNGYRLIICQK